MKGKIDHFIKKRFADKFFDYSCERIAQEIGEEFDAFSVKVSEDGENYGTLFQ